MIYVYKFVYLFIGVHTGLDRSPTTYSADSEIQDGAGFANSAMQDEADFAHSGIQDGAGFLIQKCSMVRDFPEQSLLP